jgi:hypothetical protein
LFKYKRLKLGGEAVQVTKLGSINVRVHLGKVMGLKRLDAKTNRLTANYQS